MTRRLMTQMGFTGRSEYPGSEYESDSEVDENQAWSTEKPHAEAFRFLAQKEENAISVRGYSYMKQLSLGSFSKMKINGKIIDLQLTNNESTLSLSGAEFGTLDIPLSPIRKQIIGTQRENVPAELMMVDAKNAKIQVRIYFDSIQGTEINGVDRYTNLQGIILIR